MNWVVLVIAGLFEIAFAFCLGKAKDAAGSPWLLWMSAFLVCLAASMFLLYKATQTIPIGTAYAVWTGIGAIGTAMIGIAVFREPANFWRLFFMMTLIVSVVGLRLASK